MTHINLDEAAPDVRAFFDTLVAHSGPVEIWSGGRIVAQILRKREAKEVEREQLKTEVREMLAEARLRNSDLTESELKRLVDGAVAQVRQSAN